jgi:hypothetical protein
MRSRPARLILSTLAWIALSGAAFFTFQQQQRIDDRRASLRAFETTARDAADALDDLQAGQQAYVAAGQDAAEWIPKVATYLQTAATSIDTLRSTALSSGAGPSLLDASTMVTQVANIDRAVRQHVAADEHGAAADAIFGEAADAISSAVSNVDAAVSAEQLAADGFEAERKRAQIYALAATAGFVAIVLAVLGFASPAAAVNHDETAQPADQPTLETSQRATLAIERPVAAPPPPAAATPASDVAIGKLAGICTEFGRVRDAEQLKQLLRQSAALMDARGLIVWLGNSAGGDLRPVLAYGYSDATLSHLSSVPRSADNAAAAAYRTGELQIVKSRPGGAQGAVVAPLLSSDGCIGALTAEVRDSGEQADTTRALAQILAAQLAGVLASAAQAPAEAPANAQSATG